MDTSGFATAVLLAGMLGACESPAIERSGAAPLRGESANSRAYVTAAAVGALDASGHFSHASRAPRTADELSESQAVTLVQDYVKSYGHDIVGTWEYERGAPVRLAALTPCNGAHYAATPYADPPANVERGVRVAVDSKWLVELCDGGVPAVNVAVAAHATDTRKSQYGRLLIPGSNPFYSHGIPIAMHGSVPSPDSAVQALAQATGVQVAREPELVLPPFPYAPQLARWRVTLAAPVRVRSKATHAVGAVEEIYHGYTDSWQARGVLASTPDAAAPVAALRWQDPATGAARVYALTARPGYALNLTAVETQP